MRYTIDAEKVRELSVPNKGIDLSGINFGMLEMLEMWAEREWEKKQAGLPSEWDQGMWFVVRGEAATGTACGTTACLAGKAISITPGVAWYRSGTAVTDFRNVAIGTAFDDALLPTSIVPEDIKREYAHNKVTQDGKEYYKLDASEAGAAVLGLNSREADALFAGANSIHTVKKVIAEIKSGHYRQGYEDDLAVPTTEVLASEVCNVSANDYITSLIPENGQDNFEYAYGSCILPAHGEDVGHIFDEDH